MILAPDPYIRALGEQQVSDLAVVALVLGMGDDHQDAGRRLTNVIDTAKEQIEAGERRASEMPMLRRAVSVGESILHINEQLAERG